MKFPGLSFKKKKGQVKQQRVKYPLWNIIEIDTSGSLSSVRTKGPRIRGTWVYLDSSARVGTVTG